MVWALHEFVDVAVDIDALLPLLPKLLLIALFRAQDRDVVVVVAYIHAVDHRMVDQRNTLPLMDFVVGEFCPHRYGDCIVSSSQYHANIPPQMDGIPLYYQHYYCTYHNQVL